jgi:signal transduction histidine kinase/ligand-binding sensor domain-containing protein
VLAIAQKKYSFEHLTKKDGLSQGTVNCIHKDSRGFMWFGTNDGLNKYDGSTIEVFRHKTKDTLGLSGNLILSLAEDQNERIWISSFDGTFQYYDLNNSTFNSYQNLFIGDTNALEEKTIYNICYQHPDILWAGSKDCLFKLDLKNKKITKFSNNLMTDPLQWGNITDVAYDGIDRIWFGTQYSGMYYIDIHTDKLFHGQEKSTGKHPTDIPEITAFTIGADSNIWIGSFGNYLYVLNSKTLEVEKLNHLDSDILHNQDVIYILAIAADNDSSVWVGTNGGGVVIINVFTRKTQILSYNSSNTGGLLSQNNKSFHIDNNNCIWIGDNGFGLNYYFPFAKLFRTLTKSNESIEGLQFRSIRSIYKDDDNKLWVSGYGGLNVFDEDFKLINNFFKGHPVYIIFPDLLDHNLLWISLEGGGLVLIHKKTGAIIEEINEGADIPDRIKGKGIYSVLLEDQNGFWVGTDNSLKYINRKTFKVTAYPTFDQSDNIPKGRMRAMLLDSKDRLWIGSIEGGLSVRLKPDESFIALRNVALDKSGISSNSILCIFESSENKIYVGTDKGLNVFDDKNGNFKTFSVENGLPNDVVYGILEDEKNNLWLSTNEGISMFNPKTESFRNYDIQDGLSGNEFNSGAYHKDKDGIMYFGGIDGITYFNPEEIHDNPIKPRIHITYLKKGNEIVKLDPPIIKREELTLQYNETNISIGFTALNYYKPDKTRYAYRLSVNNTGEWIDLQHKNTIELNQLRAGTYTLHIIASNNDQVWDNAGHKLIIHVIPPIWKRWWFITIVILIISSTAIFFIILRFRIIKNQNLKLENEVQIRTMKLLVANNDLKNEIEERMKIEKALLESNNTKDKFFSIIAHDLKSPFNALLGLSEFMVEDYDNISEEEKKSYLVTFKNSVQEVFKLVQNLLTWSRAQRGYVQYNPDLIDLKLLIEENININRQQAVKKNIELYSDLRKSMIVWADQNMIDTVLRNLISNAIKFTEKRGLVNIKVEEQPDEVIISVIDTGIGMDVETQKKLFLLDEKMSTRGTENEHGTGLGLILCQEFISKNNGTLRISSTLGKGSTFTFTLPKRYEQLVNNKE